MFDERVIAEEAIEMIQVERISADLLREKIRTLCQVARGAIVLRRIQVACEIRDVIAATTVGGVGTPQGTFFDTRVGDLIANLIEWLSPDAALVGYALGESAYIYSAAVRGELTPYEAAWLILELRRPGRVSAAHPDDQNEAREIAESITRERANA